MVNLAVGVYTERRRILDVKRAETKEIAPLLAKLDVFGNHVDDIGGVADAFKCFFGYEWHCSVA